MSSTSDILKFKPQNEKDHDFSRVWLQDKFSKNRGRRSPVPNEVLVRGKRVAIQAAKKAGEIIKRDFHRKKHVSLKKDLSFVTETDLRAEQAILRIIKKNFPSHAVLSEESGGSIGEDYTWIIDPLDGTGNFVRGVPLFSASIALVRRSRPILAVVYNPVGGEWYIAQKGKGAFYNGKRIRAGSIRDAKQAIFIFNKGRGARNFLLWLKIMKKLASHIKSVRAFGSSNLEICKVAAADFEGYINLGSSPWDLIPGAFIAEEAGAVITNIDGSAFTPEAKGALIANRFLHRKILNILYGKSKH